ncbi:alpha/beta hydrolase [Undibacterium sp. YM2]|uniref:alpha/beta fold hydrolase n=1 Tax=Undibacterium sp. YM2 TaxID=2058625 RepID=UPI001331E5A2|nr:alpha/beta hydrolase [Undibacterium sp. YM2]BBB69596.1 alpha/beta hydrolase [Undibacterium sp. YM2]
MTTWVLLRGLMRESRHWGDFPAHFQQAVGAERVLCLDFPGNGQLHAEHSLTTVATMADHCHRQLQVQGVAGPVHVLAVSLGAMVALAWADRYPDDLQRMVLINTSVAPHNPFYHRLRPANYPALITTMLFGSSEQRERLILRITSNLQTAEQVKAIIKRWTAYAQEKPISVDNILRQLLAAMRFRAPPYSDKVPLLLLAGEQDKLVNAACSRKLAGLWHCPLHLHPTAGHDLPLDDAGWVIQQVVNWQVDINFAPALPPENQ